MENRMNLPKVSISYILLSNYYMQTSKMQFEQENSYMSQSMDKQTFVQILSSLSKDSAFNDDAFADYYDRIMQINKVVLGSDLYTFAKCLKQQNNKSVISAIFAIQDRIVQLQNKGIKAIARDKFPATFGNQISINQDLREHIQSQIDEEEYLSLKKLAKMLKQIRITYQDVGKIQLRQPIDVKKTYINFDQEQEQKVFDALSELFEQYCLDYMALQKANQLIETAKKAFLKMKQELSGASLNQEQLKAEVQSIQNQCYQKQQIINQQNQNIQSFLEKLSNAKDQGRKWQKYFSELQIKHDNLQYQKQLLQQQYSRIQIKCAENQEKMKHFFQDRNTIVAQFSDFVEKYEKQRKKTEQIQQSKIFSQRTLKQRLQDANLKIDRLMKQKISMQQKMQQTQQAFQVKLNQLQEQINAFQLKKVRDSSIGRLQFSCLSNKTQRKYVPSQFEKHSQYLVAKNSKQSQKLPNQPIRNSQNQQQIKYKAKQNIQTNFNSSTDAFKKKKLDESIFEKIISQSQKKQSEQVLANDFLGVSDQNLLSNTKSFIKRISSDQNIRGIFTSQIFIVKSQGNNYEMFIAVTSQKIYLLDTKYREKQSFKLQNLVKLFICYYNQQWLVLRLKKSAKAEKKQFRDIVISVSNRTEFLRFLSKRCSQRIKQTQIVFEKQNKISLQTQTSTETSKLSQYAEVSNPYRLCYFNSFSIFTVKMENQFLLDVFASEYLLVIQPIGILFYAKEDSNSHDLTKKSKLQDFMPIVQEMQISILHDYKIRIIYPNYKKKQYKITTNSFAISKKLMKQIQEAKRVNLMNKKNKLKILQSLFPQNVLM